MFLFGVTAAIASKHVRETPSAHSESPVDAATYNLVSGMAQRLRDSRAYMPRLGSTFASPLSVLDWSIVYAVVVLFAVESLFNFYRYYTTHITARYIRQASTREVLRHFSPFAGVFLAVCACQLHVFYLLCPVALALYVGYNVRCVLGFNRIMVEQYKEFRSGLVPDDMLQNVLFMRNISLLSCLASSLSLAFFVVADDVRSLYYLPLLWATAALSFTLNFVRNRQLLYLALFSCYACLRCHARCTCCGRAMGLPAFKVGQVPSNSRSVHDRNVEIIIHDDLDKIALDTFKLDTPAPVMTPDAMAIDPVQTATLKVEQQRHSGTASPYSHTVSSKCSSTLSSAGHGAKKLNLNLKPINVLDLELDDIREDEEHHRNCMRELKHSTPPIAGATSIGAAKHKVSKPGGLSVLKDVENETTPNTAGSISVALTPPVPRDHSPAPRPIPPSPPSPPVLVDAMELEHGLKPFGFEPQDEPEPDPLGNDMAFVGEEEKEAPDPELPAMEAFEVQADLFRMARQTSEVRSRSNTNDSSRSARSSTRRVSEATMALPRQLTPLAGEKHVQSASCQTPLSYAHVNPVQRRHHIEQSSRHMMRLLVGHGMYDRRSFNSFKQLKQARHVFKSATNKLGPLSE